MKAETIISPQILDNYPEGACIVDDRLKVVYSNGRGVFGENRKLFGELKEYLRLFLDRAIPSHENIITRNGSRDQYQVKAALIQPAPDRRVLLTVRDVTAEMMLESKMYQRSEELSILYEINSLDVENLRKDRIVAAAIGKLAELTAMDTAVLAEFTQDKDDPVRLHDLGATPEFIGAAVDILKDKRAGALFRREGSALWRRPPAPPKRVAELMASFELTTIVKIPVLVRGNLTGVVLMGSRESSPVRVHDNVRFFDLIARQLSITLERAELFYELERSFREIDSKNRMFSEQLKLAQRLQSGILQIQFPKKPQIDFTVKYIPSYHLGGDFYDIFEIKNQIGVLIADVCGHGVSSALITTFLKAAARDLSQKLDDPSHLLTRLNRKLVPTLPDEMFISAFYLILDLDKRELRFSNGGHPLPLYFDAGTDEVRELDIPGMLLSVSEKTEFVTRSVGFRPGDKIFLFTDGLYEIEDARGKLLGVDRIKEIVFQHRKKSSKKIVETLMEAVYRFGGSHELKDDLNLIGIDFL